MTLQRRQFLHLAASVAAWSAAPRNVFAQSYPTRPVTMVVPFPAAGPADVLARILSEPIRASLGQPVVIENISGAAGSIAVGRVARAAPDGYTIILGNLGTHVVNGSIYSLQYDLVKDFEPICMLPTNYQLLIARSGVPANDLKELISWLKANASKITIGTAGPGAPSHLTAVYFQKALGAQFQLVPYRGTPQVLADLIAGQIDLVFDQASSALPLARSGKVRTYGVTALQRLATAPDIPTLHEGGLPNFQASYWFGLWAPKGTPANVVARLNAAAVAALSDPAVSKRLSDLGAVLPRPDQLKPEALGALQRSEIERWAPIIRAANIKGK
ncbi:MAG: tripartite tricarboxylate transporter substrate binding protein BugD [Rhizobiales bacterium]|nr:tripartite tricarboxylate transporter substrate binding protein BugD [Hyphomicrobiales bacterium]